MATHSSILALENPRDRGAWWAPVRRVSHSLTQLKQLGTHASHPPHEAQETETEWILEYSALDFQNPSPATGELYDLSLSETQFPHLYI